MLVSLVDYEQMLGLTLNFERLIVSRTHCDYFNLKHDKSYTMSEYDTGKIDLLSVRFFLTLDAIINFRLVSEI